MLNAVQVERTALRSQPASILKPRIPKAIQCRLVGIPNPLLSSCRWTLRFRTEPWRIGCASQTSSDGWDRYSLRAHAAEAASSVDAWQSLERDLPQADQTLLILPDVEISVKARLSDGCFINTQYAVDEGQKRGRFRGYRDGIPFGQRKHAIPATLDPIPYILHYSLKSARNG